MKHVDLTREIQESLVYALVLLVFPRVVKENHNILDRLVASPLKNLLVRWDFQPISRVENLFKNTSQYFFIDEPVVQFFFKHLLHTYVQRDTWFHMAKQTSPSTIHNSLTKHRSL
jgi:hypothetical protein